MPWTTECLEVEPNCLNCANSRGTHLSITKRIGVDQARGANDPGGVH